MGDFSYWSLSADRPRSLCEDIGPYFLAHKTSQAYLALAAAVFQRALIYFIGTMVVSATPQC